MNLPVVYKQSQWWNITGMAIALVIPCYNYGHRIQQTLTQVSDWRQRNASDLLAYFVDDGSTDNTAEVLQRFAAENSEWCKIIICSQNQGKGAAVRAGMKAAVERADYVVFTDCDLHYGLDIIVERVVPELEHSDVVILDRTWDESSHHPSLRRRIASGLFSRTVGTLVGLTYCDSQAGLKGFRSSSCAPIFSLLRINGFAFDAEILSIAYYYRLKVIQIPVSFGEGYSFPESSSINLIRSSFKMLLELLRINLNWKRGLYAHSQLRERIAAATYLVGKKE